MIGHAVVSDSALDGIKLAGQSRLSRYGGIRLPHSLLMSAPGCVQASLGALQFAGGVKRPTTRAAAQADLKAKTVKPHRLCRGHAG
jgi:hypothetical protein